jgi:hypothetical protein
LILNVKFNFLKPKKMTVIIDKTNSKNISKILNEKLGKRKKTGNLTKHFGKLKRKIDGLVYQLDIRKNKD